MKPCAGDCDTCRRPRGQGSSFFPVPSFLPSRRVCFFLPCFDCDGWQGLAFLYSPGLKPHPHMTFSWSAHHLQLYLYHPLRCPQCICGGCRLDRDGSGDGCRHSNSHHHPVSCFMFYFFFNSFLSDAPHTWCGGIIRCKGGQTSMQ